MNYDGITIFLLGLTDGGLPSSMVQYLSAIMDLGVIEIHLLWDMNPSDGFWLKCELRNGFEKKMFAQEKHFFCRGKFDFQGTLANKLYSKLDFLYY